MKSLREVGCPFSLSGKHNKSVESILCKLAWPQWWKCVQDSLLASCAQSSDQAANQIAQGSPVASLARPLDGKQTPGTISPSGNFRKQMVPEGKDIPLRFFTPGFQVRSAPTKPRHLKE